MSNPSQIGEITEAIVVVELVKRGYRVLTPYLGNSYPYDLVVERDGKLDKVQCKTGSLRNGVIYFATSRRSKSWSAGTMEQIDYLPTEVDVFMVYCPQTGKVYSIPLSEVSPGNSRLRIAPAKNNQNVGVRWAHNYELPDAPPIAPELDTADPLAI